MAKTKPGMQHRRDIGTMTEQSSRPIAQDSDTRSLHQYRIELLAEDIVGLVHVVGEQRTVIVGHDWGGVISWKIAHDTPELVQKLLKDP
jgi:pimeloyl-ACP methyl ester carboxylesterase